MSTSMDRMPFEKKDFPNKTRLGSVTEYAKKWEISRDLVYDRLNKGTLTAYEMEDEGNFRYYVELDTDPEVREYKEDSERENPTV